MARIQVYGAKERCASCMNAPSSEETASWLEAALQRVFRDIAIEYIDINEPKSDEEKQFAQRVFDEDLWYPVVVIDGAIITEGNPDLKVVYQKLDDIGVPRKE